jgi:hypothetical protein
MGSGAGHRRPAVRMAAFAPRHPSTARVSARTGPRGVCAPLGRSPIASAPRSRGVGVCAPSSRLRATLPAVQPAAGVATHGAGPNPSSRPWTHAGRTGPWYPRRACLGPLRSQMPRSRHMPAMSAESSGRCAPSSWRPTTTGVRAFPSRHRSSMSRTAHTRPHRKGDRDQREVSGALLRRCERSSARRRRADRVRRRRARVPASGCFPADPQSRPCRSAWLPRPRAASCFLEPRR